MKWLAIVYCKKCTLYWVFNTHGPYPACPSCHPGREEPSSEAHLALLVD